MTREAALPPSLVRQLTAPDGAEAPLPTPVADQVKDLVGIGVAGRAAEWTTDEVYVAAPGPGSDAWVSIDRASGAILSERTDRASFRSSTICTRAETPARLGSGSSTCFR